jgi:hypothetical protein
MAKPIYYHPCGNFSARSTGERHENAFGKGSDWNSPSGFVITQAVGFGLDKAQIFGDGERETESEWTIPPCNSDKEFAKTPKRAS